MKRLEIDKTPLGGRVKNTHQDGYSENAWLPIAALGVLSFILAMAIDGSSWCYWFIGWVVGAFSECFFVSMPLYRQNIKLKQGDKNDRP